MGVSINATSDNFNTDVVEASYQRPVLVDFFATWCGPCQLLKPMLEKLVQEYDFVLAKVDIDRSPDLAQAYHIEGVPDVRIVVEGKMYQGFVGVLPEPKLREFLVQQLHLESDLDRQLEAAQVAIAAGETAEAKAIFARLSEQYPQSPQLAIAAAKFLIGEDRLGSAEKLLASIDERDREHFAKAEALRNLIQLKSETQKPITHDLDAPFFAAIGHTLGGNYEAALQGLLDLIRKDRKYRGDGARKAMIMIFDLLGDDHPLTKQYRKQLTLTLF